MPNPLGTTCTEIIESSKVLKTRNTLLETLQILSRDMLSTEEFSYFDLLSWITNSTSLNEELDQDLKVSPEPTKTDHYFRKISRETAILQIWIAMKFSQIMDNDQVNFDFLHSLIRSTGSGTEDNGFTDFEYLNIDLNEEAIDDIQM